MANLLPNDTREFLGLGEGLPYNSYVTPPSFNQQNGMLTDKSALVRKARFQASAEMLFKTDISKLDDVGVSGLYQCVTEGMFGLKDTDGQMAFGKRASKNPRENLEMLRRFVKGDYTLIEDPEYTKWREMDEEGKFQYALENESKATKVKSHLKGERGASLLEQANAVASVGPKVMGPDAIIADFFTPKKEKERKEHVFHEAARRSNYDTLNDEEKAAYRADVIGDYEEKLSRRQTLKTYLQFASNLSDKAAYLLAESFQKGAPDINVEMLDPEERDRVYSAFSLMRGDKKRGRILGIETDFTDDTAMNRFQLGLYGLQQSFVGLGTAMFDMARDGAMWAYAKATMDDAERKAFFEGWDANVRAERAMEQALPEAEGWFGAGFQGFMENVHWFIPYGAIGKGAKMMSAANKMASRAKLQKEVFTGAKTLAEMNAAAAKTRWLSDVEGAVKAGKGAKKVNEFQSALAMRRELAAVERYTKALEVIPGIQKAAKVRDAAGASMWAIGEASALSAFASEYVAAADAAGVSREESMITAWAIGLVNARIEWLYVAGLESSLTASQVKALTFKALYNAVKSDGAAGFRKWFVNRVQRDVVEGAKVAASEGLIEEPLQQLATEHGIEFDKLCAEMRKNGETDFADKAEALWRSFAKQLPEDYGVFVDTVVDSLPTSLAFGATSVGNIILRQHLHNVITRHMNRRAGSTSTMLTARNGQELMSAIDYDAGVIDIIQQAVNTRAAVEKYWKGDKSDEAKNPHRFLEAITAARRAYRKAQTRDVVQEVAEAAGVDVKTAEVITQYLQTEAEAIAFSPQARAFSSLRMSLADIDETTIKTVLPGYIEGSYAADEKNGIYSGRVKLGDGTERTIAYRVGDVSEMLREQVEENSKIDSSFGISFDDRQEELGTGITWASLSDAQRYQYALTLSNAFSSGRGVFELTDAKGEKVRVNADDVIYLANGRLGDIGYGPAASMGTARHETWHSLWRFARATLDEEDVQSLAKALGVDVTANRWENKLDERMAHQLEMYASGHYVSHAVSSRFDKMLDGWAGKVIKFFGSFGPADEVRDPKTGKSFALKDFYDMVLKGELGSGKLGVEIRAVPAVGAAENPTSGTMPVEVTDADRAAQEAEMREDAAESEESGVRSQESGVGTNPSVLTPNPSKTNSAENPADASVPNARYYKIGLPNSDVKLVGRLEVRDAHTGLTTSTDEDYHDRGNQNRDDKSEESRALVMKIAGHPDPLQIGTVQPIANNGIVWSLPNGDVIIGNHRVNGVRAGYEKGTAEDLEKFVREDAAKRGIEIGEGVNAPLTVFVLERIESPDSKADVHEVVRLANESQNRGFNIREQAGNDAKILIDNNLLSRMAFRADGRIDETKSADAIGKFRQESGAQGLVGEDGMLTEEGSTRIQNAAVTALLGGTGNNALLGRIMENAGRLDIASQLRALMKVTPELMSLAKTKPEFDIRDALAEALTLYTEWREKDEEKRSEKGKSRHDWRELDKEGKRKRGLSWEAYLSQGDMFRTPSEEAKILGDLFARTEQLRSFDREDVESAAGKKRVVDLITDYLTDYIENARNVNTETEDMFGGTPASRAEVLAAQRAKGESGARFSIAGARGASALGVRGVTDAEAMEKDGRSRTEIWRKTGWWRGTDGKWRFELPPVRMKGEAEVMSALRDGGNESTLGKLLDAPELFKAYPKLEDTKIVLSPEKVQPGEPGGWYDRLKNEIVLFDAGTVSLKDMPKKERGLRDHYERILNSDEYLNRAFANMDAFGIEHGTGEEEREYARRWIERQKNVINRTNETRIRDLVNDRRAQSVFGKIVHEVQHAVQRIEGFAGGASGEEYGYRRFAGEVEARNAARRDAMTPEERAATPPWETEDVPADSQIMRFSLVTPSEDAAYIDAVKRGDMEAAQTLLKAAWERSGYSPDTSYKDAHAAPSAPVETKDFKNVDALKEARDEGWDLNLWAIAKGITGQPDDFFDERGPSLYGYDDAAGREAQLAIAQAIADIRGGNDMTRVIVYRAVPKGVKFDGLQSGGQWVSPSKTYVENHGKSRFGYGEYRIVREVVRAENLWWDGNDAREWGYDDGRQYVYLNAENGMKLATVTYDDAGNIIPLSQRFNQQKSDVRFSMSVNPKLGEDIREAVNTDRNTKPVVSGHKEVVFASHAPQVLIASGIPDGRIYTHAFILRKMKDHHDLDEVAIENLVSSAQSPAAILHDVDKKKGTEAFIILTEQTAKDLNGRVAPVMIYLRPDSNGNYIASAYARTEKGEKHYIGLLNSGSLLAINKSKVAGLNLTGEAKSSFESVRTDDNVVDLERFTPQIISNSLSENNGPSAELLQTMGEKAFKSQYGIGSAARNGEGFVDLERGDTFKGIEKAVREKVHEQVENTYLGITAMIGSNTNADHLVHKDSSFGDEDPEAHKYAVKNTLELFKKAKTAVVHHDKKGTKNDYIRAFTPFYFRDGIYLATITLRRDKDSDKFYSIEAVETERGAAPGVPHAASKMDSGDSPRSSRRTAQEAQSPESLKTGDSPRSSRRTAQEAQSPVSLEDKISYYLGNVNETEPKFVNSGEKFSQEELLRRIRADISTLQGRKYSVAAEPSPLFKSIAQMSDDDLVTAAVAVRMALGKSDKVSDRAVKINTVQQIMRRLHPEYKSTDVGRESMRVISDARKFAKKIREDLDRGVSDSLILEHLPQTAREQFGREMVEEARRGQRLGRFGQKVASKLEDRQARIVEDAVRIQTGMDVSLMENLYGINLSETIMHLAENPLTEKPKQSAGAGEGETAEAVEESAGEEAEPVDVSAAVKAAVDEIVSAAKTATDANERNRADRRAAAGRDAERSAELGGEESGAEGGAGEDFGGEDIVAVATKKAGLDLENPRHLAEFVAELTRRYWIKEHELGQNAEVWRDLVAVQFLRKTAQGIYAKLCKDLTYSRSRETAMQRIAKFDNVPTVQGLLTEMAFVGALINAQRIRDTQKEMCEKLDLFLRQKFGAQGRFKPDKEEGKRNVSAEAELRARYMRHAMWLTPDAAADEARELQEKLDLLAVEFSDAGRDRDQSREFVETSRKLNILREFGALRYKPVGEIEAAAKWWEDFERGESDDIVREMSDRDIRTKKAAELLAKAFADPKRVTAREGATTADRINKFLTGHMGFVALINDCMRHAADADREAVKDIVGWLELEIQKAGDGTAAEKRRHNDAFHAAVESIYAKSFNKVMKEMMAEDDRFLKFMGEVGGKRDIPTKGRAMQLLVSLLQEGRKIEVEDEENPGKTKFIYEGGYHDNIVKHKREGQAAELMKLMSPADMNMIKWLGMWYENNRQDLSNVCHSLFGIGVYAELPNYFPVKMRLDKQGLEKGAAVGWTIFPKALTPRVKNERDFDTSADIFQMWSSRMEEGAQWKHHAKLGLEMRGIFGRAELQGAVISNHGEATNALMQGFITDILAGKGAVDRSTGDVQYISDKIRGWTALCALGGNLGVMLKQPTSIPAFGFEIGLVDTARHIVSAFTPEGLAAMGKIWQSEQRKTRWDVGYSEAVANALREDRPSKPINDIGGILQRAGNGSKEAISLLKRMLQASMITNKIGDVVPALIVGQGIYRDCIAQGMSETDAMAKTWMLVERNQQSSRMENLASIQRRNVIGRMMYQFLSTQRQYLDYELRAIREVIAQPSSVSRWKKLGTTILLNHFILTSAYYWMGQLYKAMLGQEPPEDELTDWVITCLLGPYGSLFVAGFCCNYTLQRALKGYSYGGGSSMLPMESWLKNQVNDGAKLIEAIFDSEGDTWDNMLDAAGKWMSDSNSLFRDLRKIYRFRINGEEQGKR